MILKFCGYYNVYEFVRYIIIRKFNRVWKNNKEDYVVEYLVY